MQTNVLEKRIGDFNFIGGCRSAIEFKDRLKRLQYEHGDEGFKELYNESNEGDRDKGVIISFYQYSSGRVGSCFVLLNIEIKNDIPLLTYKILVEVDGHWKEKGNVPIGDEEKLIELYKKAMLEQTISFKEESQAEPILYMCINSNKNY